MVFIYQCPLHSPAGRAMKMLQVRRPAFFEQTMLSRYKAKSHKMSSNSSNNSKLSLRFGVLAVMIVLAAFSRMIPHMPNFSPLGAIALFGAAHFQKKWQAILIPIAATWLSDLFINNVIYARYYPEFTWFYSGFYWQYGSYVLIALLGLLIFKKVSWQRVAVGALGSSVIFFLVTNFSCWIGSSIYAQNFGGVMTCYAAGVPFLKGTLLGDFCYAAALFGSFAWMQRQIPALKPALSLANQ
jgi:hypothetical protein